MCRNIKSLFNFDPPATDEEIHDAALQFVRKISGYNKPAAANELVFYNAVDGVATTARQLLDSLVSAAPHKSREVEAAKAHARALKRFK